MKGKDRVIHLFEEELPPEKALREEREFLYIVKKRIAFPHMIIIFRISNQYNLRCL